MSPTDSKIAPPGGEQRFQLAFAHAAIGMTIIDSNGRIVEVNEAFCRITGYDEQELALMDFASMIHQDDRYKRLGLREQLLRGEIDSFVTEQRMLRKDGQLVWVRDSVSIARGEAGHPRVIILTEDVTERKQAEDALRTSEERFRIAAENASDLIYEWDLRTGKTRTFGFDADCFGGMPSPQNFETWKGMVHPDDLERVLAEIGRYTTTGERYSAEYRVIGEGGHTYHYSNRGQVIRNALGEPYKWVGLATDITGRKISEEAISQLAAIVQCSEDAIVGTSLDGAITTWNQGAQKLLGYTTAEILGKPLSSLSPPADRAAEVPALVDGISRGEVGHIDETVFIRKDASEVQVSLTVFPIRSAAGEISGAALIARDISARKKAEQELAHLAGHDHLTGLPNRLLLAERLAEAIAGSETTGLMAGLIYVDLDGFKFVNDTLGHEAGDALLRQVTDRLSKCVRAGDTLARMGGDEFMLIVAGMKSADTAMRVAERLAAGLRERFLVADRELYISASMGISVYPRDGRDVSTLRRNADAAMYQAKHGGKDRIRFFTPEIRASLIERLELENDLRQALDHGGFSVYYQPVFTLSGMRQTSFEALLRWFHPARGFIPPSRFIPVAEETGLIVPLGAWVLREACRQCRAWQSRGMPSVRVAVNVSALEFARDGFVEGVLDTLDQTGLQGALLELEVTETMLMLDIEDSIRKMTRLQEHGIGISVDDFGTGYSSLGYLQRLPINTLKIDRCFVAEIGANPTAVSLIEGMISLSHSLGKRVVVEGVETPEQLEILKMIGCDEVQGYLLGRPAALPPLDADQIASLARIVGSDSVLCTS